MLTACELNEDIQGLPEQGQTLIERIEGLTLERMRAKLSLARACYSSAEVVLIDNLFDRIPERSCLPVFERALLGLLKGRTVLLVTD